MALRGGYVTVLTWHPAARALRTRARARGRSPLLRVLVYADSLALARTGIPAGRMRNRRVTVLPTSTLMCVGARACVDDRIVDLSRADRVCVC